MKITTPNTNFGYFGWKASADVSDKLVAFFAGLGLLQLLQRSPATNAEKKLAGYEKRPKNFERSSIEYNDANAATFTKVMSAVLEIVDGTGDEKVKLGTLTPVIESWYHPLGETAEPVYAEEKKIVQRHIDSGDVSKWNVEKVGYEGRDLTIENVEFLRKVKAWKNDMLANA
jgi:hypothetical protein